MNLQIYGVFVSAYCGYEKFSGVNVHTCIHKYLLESWRSNTRTNNLLTLLTYIRGANGCNIFSFIISHSSTWKHFILLIVCVYSRNHGLVYNIEIGMTRFQKSVTPSVFNGTKNGYSFIINSRIIIHISGERAWRPLQKEEAILKKTISNILNQIFENYCFCLGTPPSLLSV